MKYTDIAKINVNDYVEKKNGLSYLSWAWAVDQLMRLDEAATWSYSAPEKYGETLMVFCTVTAFGRSRTAQLPVMDYKNKAISNPDSFQVNTAMQRCLAKAIALHGIGLYIYAGEDLPQTDDDSKPVASRPYPAEQFERYLPAWREAIANGTRTPNSIIAMVQTRGTLTDEQINLILNG